MGNEYPNIFAEYDLSDKDPLLNGLKTILKFFEPYHDQVKNVDEERPKVRSDIKKHYIKFNGESLKDLGNFIEVQLPSKLHEFVKEQNFENDYTYKGASNNGTMYDIAYFGVIDDIFKTTKIGIYPVYFLKPDCSGVYLALAIGSESFSSSKSNQKINDLKNLKNVCRQMFFYYKDIRDSLYNINIDVNDLEQSINLIDQNLKNVPEYQAGTIFAKEYSKDDLSNGTITENILKNDFIEFVKMYEFAKKYKIFENLKRISQINSLNIIDGEFIGENKLFYGVPGSGKSFTIEKDYCSNNHIVERVLFHPDYTYSDFIGQILPQTHEDGRIEYKFTPGPFTRILKQAHMHSDQKVILIIEEINRGNAPAIFGDIFQLLDRKTKFNEPDDDGLPLGTSLYGITNPDIAFEVYGDKEHEVRIPYNLSIIASMNTSDQNVFTLDTAFQRRWNMELIKNDFEGNTFSETEILDTGVSWEYFATVINDEILNYNKNKLSSEDKRLGAYFIQEKDLNNLDNFSEKVLKYLWDDAFKFDRNEIFNLKRYSLEDLIDKFKSLDNKNKFEIFNDPICQNLKAKPDNLVESNKGKGGGANVVDDGLSDETVDEADITEEDLVSDESVEET